MRLQVRRKGKAGEKTDEGNGIATAGRNARSAYMKRLRKKCYELPRAKRRGVCKTCLE